MPAMIMIPALIMIEQFNQVTTAAVRETSQIATMMVYVTCSTTVRTPPMLISKIRIMMVTAMSVTAIEMVMENPIIQIVIPMIPTLTLVLETPATMVTPTLLMIELMATAYVQERQQIVIMMVLMIMQTIVPIPLTPTNEILIMMASVTPATTVWSCPILINKMRTMMVSVTHVTSAQVQVIMRIVIAMTSLISVTTALLTTTQTKRIWTVMGREMPATLTLMAMVSITSTTAILWMI